MGAITEFFNKHGEHFKPMLVHGGLWLGLALCTSGGSTIDKWIELRNQAKAAGTVFHLDWLEWTKGVFFVGSACFLALRTFTDQSYSRFRERPKDTEEIWAKRETARMTQPPPKT